MWEPPPLSFFISSAHICEDFPSGPKLSEIGKVFVSCIAQIPEIRIDLHAHPTLGSRFFETLVLTLIPTLILTIILTLIPTLLSRPLIPLSYHGDGLGLGGTDSLRSKTHFRLPEDELSSQPPQTPGIKTRVRVAQTAIDPTPSLLPYTLRILVYLVIDMTLGRCPLSIFYSRGTLP